jgi:alkaline phosphatase
MYDICLQLASSNFDYFAGGGLEQSGRKKDTQPDAKDVAKQAGYTLVNSPAALKALKSGAGKVLAINATLQDASAMPYEMDRASDDMDLAAYTRKGIELLDGPQGFFMMVEGGKIDWACHANDGAASIKDTLAFELAVNEAMTFANAHPADTLIVVTGDHETGGMSIGFAGTKYSTFFEKIGPQEGSFQAFNDNFFLPYKKLRTKTDASFDEVVIVVEQYFGFKYAELPDVEKEYLQRAFTRSMGNEIERAVQEDVYQLYGGYEPFTVALTHVVNQHAGIGWTTYSHTGVPVLTFAMGVGQDMFGGYYDNTDIFRKLAVAMKMQVPAEVASN